MPGFGEAGLRTWKSVGAGFACDYRSPRPFQVLGEPAIHLAKQFEWLSATQRIFLEFPPELATPESLAVRAPFLDEHLISHADGICTEGGGRAAHVGRLLAGVIEQGGNSAENVLDTLRLTLQGRHPSSTFGGHIPRALWGSSSAEAHELLLDHLGTSVDSEHGHLIVRAAGESSFQHVESVLRCLRSNPSAVSASVFDEIMGWFGLPHGPRCADVMHEFLERVVESLDSRSPGRQSRPYPFDRWIDIWVTMTEDVREAVPLLHAVMAGPERQEQCAALLLANYANHPSTRVVLTLALDDPNDSVAATALSFLPAVERDDPIEAKKNLASRLRSQYSRSRGDNKPWIDVKDWPDVYPQVLGDEIRMRQAPPACFLPTATGAPYWQSIDLLLDVVTPGHGGPNLSSDTSHRILIEANLTPAQWYRFLSAQALSRYGVYWAWRKFILGLDADLLVAICDLLCGDPKPAVRKAGLVILCESLDTKHRDACIDLATKIACGASDSTTLDEDETTSALANLCDKVAGLSGTSKSELPEFVRIAFPEVVVTPKWYPQARTIERWNHACSAAVSALDNLVAAFHAEHGKTALAIANAASRLHSATPDSIPWRSPHLESWRVRLEALVAAWWAEASTGQSDPLDLARLGTVTRQIVGDERSLEQWQANNIKYPILDALHIPPHILRRGIPPKEATDADIRKRDWFEGLRTLRYRNTTLSLLEGLLDTHGTWQHYEWMLDVAETMCAGVSREMIAYYDNNFSSLFWSCIPVRSWLQAPAALHGKTPPLQAAKRLFQIRRHAQLDKWYDRSDDPFFLGDWSIGGATFGDAIKALVSKKPHRKYEPSRIPREFVEKIRRDHPERAQEFDDVFTRLSSTLVSSELSRTDDAPSPWTALAGSVGYLEGIDPWLQLVAGTGKEGLSRLSNDRTGRRQVLSRLVSITHPEPGLDPADGAKQIASMLAKRRVKETHLLEAGFLAPQWLPTIGMALEWPELPDALPWLKGLPWSVFGWSPWSAADLEEGHATESGDEATYLSPQFFDPITLRDQRPAGIDDARINRLVAAARVIMPPKEVDQLKAIVAILEGRSDRDSIVSEATKASRPIDPRPLALVPLAKGVDRFPDLIERMDAFHILRQVAASSRGKEEHTDRINRAVEVLARQAGAGTREQLEWMVEAARGCEDFPVIVRDDCESRVVIAAGGTPVMAFTKKGKNVKAAPGPVKDHRAFKPQRQFFQNLTKFLERSCQSLVETMVSSLSTSLNDIMWLRRHPVVREMLTTLLFADDDHVGLLTEDSLALKSHDGSLAPLDKDAQLRLVHPIDLDFSGVLNQWRSYFSEQGIRQPIEQVHRPVFRIADVADPNDTGITSVPWGSGLVLHKFLATLGEGEWWHHYHRGNEASRWFTRSRTNAIVDSTIDASGLASVSCIRFLNSSLARLTLKNVPVIAFSETLLEVYRAASRAIPTPAP